MHKNLVKVLHLIKAAGQSWHHEDQTLKVNFIEKKPAQKVFD